VSSRPWRPSPKAANALLWYVGLHILASYAMQVNGGDLVGGKPMLLPSLTAAGCSR